VSSNKGGREGERKGEKGGVDEGKEMIRARRMRSLKE